MAAPIRTLFSFFSDNNSLLLRPSQLSHQKQTLVKSHFPISLYFSTESPKQPLDAAAVSQFLINKHHFSPDAAAHIASLARLKSQENADSVLSFLKETGFSNAQLEKVLKSTPHLLSAHLDANIKRKFEVFQDLGFTSGEIVEIISRQSRVLNFSVPRISSSVSVLKEVLGSTAVAARFLKSLGSFLCDMESTLLPNVEFLKSCGVPMEQVIQLTTSPQLFLHKPENLRKFVEKAVAMGSERSSKSFIYAVRAVSSMTSENWELKLKTLRELGFSEDDIVRAFKNTPKVFSNSRKKMKRVAEMLHETGKYDRLSIASAPIVFQYSIDKRFRPRVEVLRVLEDKNLIENWPSLANMARYTDAQFFEKFVAPYFDQVGDSWSAVSGKGKLKD